MPTWGEILRELNRSNPPDFDGVRRKYLRRLNEATGRAVILYASAWFESRPIPPADLQVSHRDIGGFMESVSNVNEREVDLILHSPGGSAEAAESIVEYLRNRFDHVRAIISFRNSSFQLLKGRGPHQPRRS